MFSNRQLDIQSGFSRVVWVTLGVLGIKVAYKAVGLIEITRGVKVDRKEKSKA